MKYIDTEGIEIEMEVSKCQGDTYINCQYGPEMACEGQYIIYLTSRFPIIFTKEAFELSFKKVEVI